MKEIKSLLLFFITLALCFFLLEISLHFLIKENYDTWQLSKSYDKAPDVSCPFVEPNRTIIGEHYVKQKKISEVIRINSQCIRDYEYSLEKPADAYRIIGVGDSFTFGSSVNFEDSFLKRLEQMLNSNDKKMKYEVINLGVPGYGLEDKLKILAQKGLAYNPDMVIMQLYSDDWLPLPPTRQIIYLTEGTSVFKVFELVQKVDRKFKGRIKLVNLIDHYFDKRLTKKAYSALYTGSEEDMQKKTADVLDNLSAISSGNNISFLLITIGIDENIKRLIREKGFSILDADEALSTYKIQEVTVDYPQDPHFNQLGNQIVVESIYKKIRTNNIMKSKFRLYNFKNL